MVEASRCRWAIEDIAAKVVAVESGMPQRIKRQHDLAAIAAADRRHQFFKVFWAVRKRRLHGGEFLALEFRGFGYTGFPSN